LHPTIINIKAPRNENIKPTSEGLKDFQGYNSSLYMGDLVKDANKWVNVMKKENVDIIVAVAHSGEESDSDKYPGNRVQELAKKVNGFPSTTASYPISFISFTIGVSKYFVSYSSLLCFVSKYLAIALL